MPEPKSSSTNQPQIRHSVAKAIIANQLKVPVPETKTPPRKSSQGSNGRKTGSALVVKTKPPSLVVNKAPSFNVVKGPSVNVVKTPSFVVIKSPSFAKIPSTNDVEATTISKKSAAAFQERPFIFTVFTKWPEKRHLEKAPEISMLFKRPTLHVFGRETSCLLKFVSCFGAICKNRVHATYGLANFKPLNARTNNTVEYMDQLMKNYSDPKPQRASGGAGHPDELSIYTNVTASTGGTNGSFSKDSKDTNTNSPQYQLGQKRQILKGFYETADLTLQYLQNGITLYKQIILNLSFTRYSQDDLTLSEIKLTSGKSIIGSCMWVITYALQLLQEEPDFELTLFRNATNQKKSSNPLLVELAAEFLSVINLSFRTWAETITAIGVLERIHQKTEALFHKQTTYFQKVAPPDSEDAIFASVHLKKYRRSEDSSNLRKFEAPRVPIIGTKRMNTFPRMLYEKDYNQPGGPSWKGFDPLMVKDKVSHLKSLLSFVKQILQAVKDSAGKLILQLQGLPTHKRGVPSQVQLGHHHIQLSPRDLTCYEDGLDKMDDILTQKLAHVDWTRKEIGEFFEIDKIFLDDMDCLTLGAGLTRAILHDARHAIHLCYETSRLVSFTEFSSLPEYLKVYKKLKDDGALLSLQPPSVPSTPSAPKKPGAGGNGKSVPAPPVKKDSTPNPFDIEELKLDFKSVEAIFKSSPYFEVAKTLPIYCSQVGVTLQDSELVFTPSSEKLLSKVVPMESV